MQILLVLQPHSFHCHCNCLDFILKMTSYLNAYRNFIDITTKDGQALLSNATDKFESPLIGDNKISLRPGGNDYQRLKDNLTRLSQ